MIRWLRFTRGEEPGFGTLEGDEVAVHRGDMLGESWTTGEVLPLSAVVLSTPTRPSKMIALWNNFRALAEKLGLPEPEEPLYFIKTPNSYLPSGGVIRRPRSYDGPVVYEGELGIVIGRRCRDLPEDRAEEAIFGYTCVNDVTAARIIDRNPAFSEWCRAKSFDTFGAFGPVVATGLDPAGLRVRTVLNGEERQNYPISDMIIPPHRLVAMISRDMTLEPGDVICCGTSLGVGSMKAPENEVEVEIEGIGTLRNTFVQAAA